MVPRVVELLRWRHGKLIVYVKHCSWSVCLPDAVFAAFGSQYSVNMTIIGMVVHNLALC